MLLNYSVENFKSIGHNVELSMFPTDSEIDDRFVRFISTRAGKWKILRRGALFGPNESGKTSLIESVSYARDFIVNGVKSGNGTGINQFRGDFEDLSGTSTFQFVFMVENEVYEYGFALDPKIVYEEWLMILTEKDFAPMFTRRTSSKGITEIQIESKLARNKSKDRVLADVLVNSMQYNQKNQLFLNKLYENGIKKIDPVVTWFKRIQPVFPHTKIQFLPIKLKQDSNFKKFISDNLNKMDTGVVSVSTVSDNMDFHDFAEKQALPIELVEAVEQQRHGFFNINGKYFIFGEDKNRITLIQVKFSHRLNNKYVEFDLEDESDGTRRLLDLLPVLFALGEESKTIYLVDEIDRSLHTKLTKLLLKMFLDMSSGSLSQIIFTAHDVNLIDLDKLDQEEIWFVEKNSDGETMLKPLSDFEIKENQNVIKAYLNGRFGAVPVIKGV